MDNNMVAVSVKALEKSYKKNYVIKKVDINIKKGTIFVLLGSNGAGKTTIVKILSTLLKPDNGHVKIFNYDVIRQAHQVRLNISMTGQFAAVDDHMTARENMRFIARLRHLSKNEVNIEGLLEKFGLLEAVDQKVSTFSGGMRRKLDLAMSLIGKPSLIFLDEPTTGLDPQSRIAMWKIIKDLKQSGVTIFLTTQYLEEAEQLGDQIAILNEGKIVAHDTVEELKKLLPRGLIELKFYRKEQMESAEKILKDYHPKSNEITKTLTVTTDGSVKQISQIFEILDYTSIDIESFNQILPKLEDVFLSIVNKYKEKEGE